MRFFLFLLLFFLCFSCVDRKAEKAILLNKKLGAVSLLSTASDSLLHEVGNLSSHQQVEIFLNISLREGLSSMEMEKQEQLLLRALTLASKNEQKRILQGLVVLYQKLAQIGVSDATLKGIKRCQELENQYSLSKEEDWDVRRKKANLLNREGSYKESISILYGLLEEHRNAQNAEYVIEDLYALAPYFIRLGDLEKGLSLLNEVYFQTVAEGLTEQQFVYLSSIIDVSFKLKRYNDVVSMCSTANLDSVAKYISSSIYIMLANSYLQLQKPDSARYYLIEMNQKSQRGTGMVFYCRMAETYISENREDSATFYLNEALKAKGIVYKPNKKSNPLPLYFMYVYPSYASLLQKNGKLQQALEAFQFVEPLMKTPVSEPERLEKQIEALGRYSDFCRLTKQYEKATELLTFRDSIQRMYYENKISLDSKHWVDRFEIQELTYKNEKLDEEIKNAKRISSIFLGASITFLVLFVIIIYQRQQTKKQYKRLYENREREILLSTDLSQPVPPLPKKRELTPQKKLFQAARTMLESQKLYLNSTLTLDILAEKLSSNRSTLSACINQSSGVNFNQWVNDYRINYIKQRMTATTDLREIYKEAGFNSQNAFYSSFKKRIGCTPKEYLKKINFDTLCDTDTVS